MPETLIDSTLDFYARVVSPHTFEKCLVNHFILEI